MKSFLKQRVGKNAGRLFLHDRELADTVFQPGTHYHYIVDVENRKLLILPSEEGNTVCLRELKNKAVPLIDIRNKSSLAVFQGCTHLQITIYGDEVVIEGFVADEVCGGECAGEKRDHSSDLVICDDIHDILSVRKKAEIVLSLDDLKSVVGLEQGWAELLGSGFVQSYTHNINRSDWERLRQTEIPLKVMSLFSGAGLMDFGFQSQGLDIVFALDANPYACVTYRNNLGNHIRCGDVAALKAEDIPQVPIIIGGPPCIGFSNSNTHTRYMDNPKNMLVREFIRVVKANPAAKIFVIENVPQMLSAWQGVYLNEVNQALSDFEITSGVISAADMGSPQLRQRTIIIGSKIGRIDLPKPVPHILNTVRKAFKGLTDAMPNQRDYSEPKSATLERIRQIPEGGNWQDLSSAQDSRHHSNYLRRLLWDQPAITLANVRKALILHPSENRTLSVREMARLFDLPDYFKFFGPLSEKQQQVVNGVPVKLASAVARVIKDAICKFNKKAACTA
jgi:DNA-methyltransferase (dcm)